MSFNHHTHDAHAHSLWEELVCHLPYATFSVALSMLMLTFFYFISCCGTLQESLIRNGYHVLFHAFHYVHIVCAIVGTYISCARYSDDRLRCFLVAAISPALFCTISDALLPALAGAILGLSVDVHICFFSLPDLLNLLPFMIVGLITGYSIAYHSKDELMRYSLQSHFVHIFISSLASSFYITSYVLDGWVSVMGMLFFFLVLAVVVPCTFSDVVVPMYTARWKW